MTLRVPGAIVRDAVNLHTLVAGYGTIAINMISIVHQPKGELMMKVSIITLVTLLALSSTGAMAQSAGNALDEIAASSAARSAMNSVHRRHHGWSASRYNGHGINDLGVTTNQGRKYNGG